MTTVSVMNCAVAGRFTTIALTVQRRSARKPCRLIMKVPWRSGAERQPRFRSAARGAPRKLEGKPRLEFDHTASEAAITRLCGSEVLPVYGRAGRVKAKRGQVLLVEDVEEIGAKFQVCLFAKPRVFSEGHIYALITWPAKRVASNAGCAEGAAGRPITT